MDNDGTRLTITLDKINVAVYAPSTLRLTLDGVTIAEWQGKIKYTDASGNMGGEGGGKGFKVETEPYEASNLTYERVVRAGSHIVRLAVVNPTKGRGAGYHISLHRPRDGQNRYANSYRRRAKGLRERAHRNVGRTDNERLQQ